MDIEREAFEGFAVSSLGYFGQDLQRGKYGRYVKPSLQKCWETWQAAHQAPASGDMEPVAWANVLEWMESPLIYPFAYKAQAEAAADRNSGTVRPLVFGDTPTPATTPEAEIPDEWFHALRDCLMAWADEADEGDGILEEHGDLFDRADALVGKEMRRRGFLTAPPHHRSSEQ